MEAKDAAAQGAGAGAADAAADADADALTDSNDTIYGSLPPNMQGLISSLCQRMRSLVSEIILQRAVLQLQARTRAQQYMYSAASFDSVSGCMDTARTRTRPHRTQQQQTDRQTNKTITTASAPSCLSPTLSRAAPAHGATHGATHGGPAGGRWSRAARSPRSAGSQGACCSWSCSTRSTPTWRSASAASFSTARQAQRHTLAHRPCSLCGMRARARARARAPVCPAA